MRIPEVCELLHVTEEELLRLIEAERLPARKAGGLWRFRRDEIIRWLGEHHLPGISRERWRQIEFGRAARTSADLSELLIVGHIPPGGIVLDLPARTKASVLREMVRIAEATGMTYDPAELSEALRVREEVSSTALPGGVALPHPGEPLPYTLADSFVLAARTARPVPFGAADGGLTDIYFLVACQNVNTHVHILARIARLLGVTTLAADLRAAATPEDARATIRRAEAQLLLELDDRVSGHHA